MTQPSMLSVLPEELAARIPALSPPEARRLLSIVHRTGAWPPMTPSGVRRESFFRARDSYSLETLTVAERRPSSLDPFVKYGFRAPDGAVVEAVRIPLERPNRFVVCVSCQVGCALKCAYCATGRMGLVRNLLAWEIVDQVRQVRDDLPPGGRVHGVVFQGMGEPLANVEAVVQSIRVMTDSSLQAIDGRAMTVSTAGLVKPLPSLLRQVPRVRLGVSVGHADPKRRAALMPVEKSNPLFEVLEIAAHHARRTRIATMLSCTLLGGVNDGAGDAEAFAGLVRRYREMAQMDPRISLIAYNPIGPEDPFSRSEPERAEQFRERLRQERVPVVRRYSGGGDVGAACGQLGGFQR